ncbi:MAG: hypothetical protein QOI65_1304 [Thermoleophilaceae bacterium]|nr:hypothetical protein [Thermoleophilaceae bacterium]
MRRLCTRRRRLVDAGRVIQYKPAIPFARRAVLTAAFLALAAAPAAQANTVQVQNHGDAGPGSLRQAIIDANPNDTVAVPAGTYHLTTGQLQISENLTVDGAGAGTTIIDAGGLSRVFFISDGAVTLKDLAISGGRDPMGGGIYASTVVTLDGVAVRAYTAAPTGTTGVGGGIFFTGPAADTLTLTRSSVTGNRAGGGPDSNVGYGGGIWLDQAAAGTGRTLALDHSTVARNAAGGGNFNGNGGGIATEQGNANVNVEVTLVDSTISGNTAGGGGESGDGSGGGIWLLAANATAMATLDVAKSTISGNRAGGGDGNGNGGGIDSIGAERTITVTDSTLAGNVAGGGGPEGDGLGGAIAFEGGGSGSTLTLRHATVAGNVAGGGGGDGLGGGIFGAAGSTVRNSIVSGNAGGFGPNCDATVGSSSHNIENGDSCFFISNGNMITDPKLRPLGNYGGPTKTMPPKVGSPAIDNAEPGYCTSSDQRGVARGAACDIGAAELVFANLGVTAAVSVKKAPVGRTVKYTYKVTNHGPSAAAGATLTDVLPAKLARVGTGGACAGTRTLSCSLGTIPAGGTRTVPVTVRALRAGTIANRATVSSFAGDTVPGNDSAGASFLAIPSLTKLSVKPRKFRLDDETSIRFKLSDKAKVTLTFLRKVNGKFKKVAKLTLPGERGIDIVGFKPKRDEKQLLPGRYKVRAVASDKAGNHSPAKTAKFRLLPAKH